MPWTGPEFKAKHWKDATPEQANHAARIATAMIGSGTAEGTAIATAIKHAKLAHAKRVQQAKRRT